MNDELTISGYIHNIERIHFEQSVHIPPEIVALCFEFYHIGKDKFHPELHAPLLKVTDEYSRSWISTLVFGILR